MTQINFSLSSIDVGDGGVLRIVGSTKNTPDHPVSRRVRLHDQRTGRVVRETWSDPVTGAYSFDWIRAGLYYVTSFDHTNTYGGVIETDVTPEPMP
jgi:hypothetical protein